MARILILSQAFVPDPISTGQHMADVATELRRRGHEVQVFSSRRGLDDPSTKFKKKEVWDNGVKVRRFAATSFGKTSIIRRLLGSASFVVQALLHGLLMKRPDVVLVCTSPPLAPLTGIWLNMLRRVRVVFWIHDLNPDQLIALGGIKESSLVVKLFNWMMKSILRRASQVIVLDEFMAERVKRKRDVDDKLQIAPPWPHDHHMKPVDHDVNPFRKEYGLEDKVVVMYSGNHGLASPVDPVVAAAKQLESIKELQFVFIGGGAGKAIIEQAIEEGSSNILSLPYQPLETVSNSLSAADIHVVIVGNKQVGIVHPCKVYSALAVERPILLIGPNPCHATHLIDKEGLGWQVEQGDVVGVVDALKELLATSSEQRIAMGRKGGELRANRFSQDALCGKLCDWIEVEP